MVFLSFWQAASAAGHAQEYLEQDADLTHLVMHWQSDAHHHDDDGSIHADDSHDSTQHVMADCSTHHLGLITMPAAAALEQTPQRVAPVVRHLPPLPYLDGLLRPPRHLS